MSDHFDPGTGAARTGADTQTEVERNSLIVRQAAATMPIEIEPASFERLFKSHAASAADNV